MKNPQKAPTVQLTRYEIDAEACGSGQPDFKHSWKAKEEGLVEHGKDRNDNTGTCTQQLTI
jgi:hypothetical protein